MYEPFNRFKFGQFAAYLHDEMRAGVKYFAQQKGVARHLRDASGPRLRSRRVGRGGGAGAGTHLLQIVAAGQLTRRPILHFTSAVTKALREANCDMVVLGTIVRDTIIILQIGAQAGLY